MIFRDYINLMIMVKEEYPDVVASCLQPQLLDWISEFQKNMENFSPYQSNFDLKSATIDVRFLTSIQSLHKTIDRLNKTISSNDMNFY